MPASHPDHVDELIGQWSAVRPDLGSQLPAMATFGRLARLTRLSGRSIEGVFARHGLSSGEFDVLAAIRRSGEPYTLMPSELTRTMMLSPAGTTNPLDRLEALGHITRQHDPDDRRSTLVVLTAAGLTVVDRAVAEHVANEAQLLDVLTVSERAAFDRALRKLVGQFD